MPNVETDIQETQTTTSTDTQTQPAPSVEEAADVGDMLDLPVEEPAQETKPETKPTPETDAAKKAEEKSVVPEKLKVGDKEFTAEEILAAFQTREQFPNLQKRYVELLEKLKGQETQPKPTDTKPTTPQWTPDQLVHHYEPQVKALAEKGFVEPEFAEAFPKWSAQALLLRDAVIRIGRQQAELIRDFSSRQQSSTVSAVIGNLDKSVDGLIAKGGDYVALQKAEAKEDFLNRIAEKYPNLDPQLMDTEMMEMFFNKLYSPIVQEAKRQEEETKKRAQARKVATVQVTGSSRPGPVAAPSDEAADVWEMLGLS
jgi:hypothetical protein